MIEKCIYLTLTTLTTTATHLSNSSISLHSAQTGQAFSFLHSFLVRHAGIQWSTHSVHIQFWPAKHFNHSRPKAQETTAGLTTRKRCLPPLSVQCHWFLHVCLLASSAGQMLDGSVSCFQPCPTPAFLPQQSSSWMCTSPTAAEMTPQTIRKYLKVDLLSVIWPCSGDDGALHCLFCPRVVVAGQGHAGPLQGYPEWVKGCGTRSGFLHPSAAGWQPGQSDHYLTQPEPRSRWSCCKQKNS